MTAPARVLWLAKGLGAGGAERLLCSCATRIDTNRFQVEVAYVLPWKDALVGELHAAGLNVSCLGRRSRGDVTWVPRLRALVKRHRYDLIHTHMPVPAAVARVLLRRPTPALVHTEHNVWNRYRFPTYWANSLTYHRNNKVIAVSQAVADSIRPTFARLPPVEVLRHGIDIPDIRRRTLSKDAARQALSLPESAFVVGTVGNLTAKKDHRTLLDALALLRRRQHHVRLVIVGSGPLDHALRHHAQKLGIADVVTFTGSRDDVPAVLSALDVFAMSSRFEGLSIALLEALAVGLPVVVTRVGGMPEVITDQREGFLVAPGDAPAMSDALAQLATDDASRARMSDAAVRRASDFTIDASIRRIQQIYDEVLAA